MESGFVSIPEWFQGRAREHPERIAYATRVGDTWRRRTWSTYADEVRSFSKALIAAGVGKGSVVAILSGNRPEWTIADMGAMSAGAASMGIYFTCSAQQIRSLLTNSGASVVVVENAALLERVLEATAGQNSVRRIVHVEDIDNVSDDRLVSWSSFIAGGSAVTDDQFEVMLHSIEADDLSSLVYTSGTTDEPKGVMLSHRRLVAITEMGLQMIGHPTADYRLLSYLPLAHVAERGLTILGPAMQGYAVYFAESVEKLPEQLREVRPSFFLGVPRVWEKIHDALIVRFSRVVGLRARLLEWALRQGRDSSQLRIEGQLPGFIERQRHRMAKRLVLNPILRQLGFDKVTTAISGSAPMAVPVLEFFASLGIVIQEVYGLSETGGPASFCRENALKFGTVGMPFDGVEIQIADDGEIMIRGANIFSGYLNNPEGTAAVLEDGWLHSGDLGEIDDDGFLTIVGRKKDLLITAYGKNIVPRKIEAALVDSPFISEAVVVGDRQKFVGALLVLDVQQVGRALGIQLDGDIGDREDVHALVQKHVDEVNSKLSRAESVRRFIILSRPLAIATGEYTPTMKLIRGAVERNFEAEIRMLFAENPVST